jgi:hypothetical protein
MGGGRGQGDPVTSKPLHQNKRRNKKMKGLMWNCRGIKKKGVSSFLINLILEHKFHFIGLQETMQENIDNRTIKEIDPNNDYLWKWIPSKGRSGGILSGVNLEHFDVGAFAEGEYTLQLNLWDKKKRIKWNFMNVYGVAQEEDKNKFLTELARGVDRNKDPLLIGGDFNIIRSSNEKNKGGIYKHTGVFNSIINTFELIDIKMCGGKFTWSNNQSNPTLERLDRFLVSKSREHVFPLALVYRLPRELSNHNPLILTLPSKQPMKNLNFRFELSWLKHPDFLPKVEEIWNRQCHAKSVIDKIHSKLKRIKSYLKGWGFNVQGEMKKIREQSRRELLNLEQIEEELMLTLEQMNRKVQINNLLYNMMEDDELYWLKRSHETWLHKGDNNTEFFHMVANGRKRKNTIISLMKDENRIGGDENLLNHATEYYKELFGQGSGNIFSLDPSLWDDGEKVSDAENSDLTRPFTEQEIKSALDQMEENKAAGPDSMPTEFYQYTWGIIKKDIIGLFNEFHDVGLAVSRLNYGVITLLPKVADAEKIQQYRPICLLNCLYKWITKVLTIRLEKVVEKLILQNQTAFLKGRNIMSGIMALHEVLHETKRRNETGIVLKLDFEKAYDKVCWEFLFRTMEMRGFCTTWCAWIKQVVTGGGTVCVKLNNRMGPYFVSHKGVR